MAFRSNIVKIKDNALKKLSKGIPFKKLTQAEQKVLNQGTQEKFNKKLYDKLDYIINRNENLLGNEAFLVRTIKSENSSIPLKNQMLRKLNALEKAKKGPNLINKFIEKPNKEFFKDHNAIEYIKDHDIKDQQGNIIAEYQIGDNYFYQTFNNNKLNKVKIVDGIVMGSLEGSSGDEKKSKIQELLPDYAQNCVITGMYFKPWKNNVGGFFKGRNCSGFDLTKYQIYTLDQLRNNNDVKISCLKFALLALNGPEIDVPQFIKKSTINQICAEYKIEIHLRVYSDDYATSTRKYNKDSGCNIYNLCLYKNHYFIYEELDTEIIVRLNQMGINGVKTSGAMIKALKNKGFIVIDQALLNINYFQSMNVNVEINEQILKTDCNLTGKIIFKNKKNKKGETKVKPINREVYFCGDTEAKTNLKGEQTPVILAISYQDDSVDVCCKYSENGQELVDYMIKYIKHVMKQKLLDNEEAIDVIVYFHNMKYDACLLAKYLNWSDGNQLIGSDGYYEIKLSPLSVLNKRGLPCTINVKLRDSYKLISQPLAMFTKTYNLKCKKQVELICYSMFTENNFVNNIVDVKEYLKLCHEKGVFGDFHQKYKDINPVEKANKRKLFNNEMSAKLTEYCGGSFDFRTLIKNYCIDDVVVLREGLHKFFESFDNVANKVNKITGKPFYSLIQKTHTGVKYRKHPITLPSYAHKIFEFAGAHKDIMKVSKLARRYFGKYVRGGRVYLNGTYKKKIITQKTTDIDANSLYPSAIALICEELGGFPIGMCKIIEGRNKVWTDESYLPAHDYYLAEVEILSFNGKNSIPMLAKYGESGVLEWNNVTGFYYMDKITLQDLIRFEKITFKMKKILIWDQGCNDNFKLISELYKMRKQFAKEGEGLLAGLIKLILNSAYGKTIEKIHTSVNKVMSVENIFNHVSNVGPGFKNAKTFGDKALVSDYEIDDSFSAIIIGIMVLSMSKRIMNEVCYLLDKDDIIYTDTDSIHMLESKLSKLEEDYRNLYKKELMGNELGQFKVDYDDEVSAVESIYLGKKNYCNMLSNGKCHNRIRGISKSARKEALERYNMKNELELFKELIVNDEIMFKEVYNGNKFRKAKAMIMVDLGNVSLPKNGNKMANKQTKKNGNKTIEEVTDIYQEIGKNRNEIE